MNSGAERLTLEGVAFREGDWFVAVCVNHYLVTCARDQHSLLQELVRIIEAHIAISMENGREPFVDLPEAPPKYRAMLERAKATARNEPMNVPEPPVGMIPHFPSVELCSAF